MKEFNIILGCGPKLDAFKHDLLEEMEAFLFESITPATLRNMKATVLRVMHRHGSEIKDDDLVVEFDPGERKLVVTDRLRQAIDNLESQVMGDGGWWRDPTFAIEAAIKRHPNLPLDVIMDLIETGISIGVEQYGG